MTALEHLRAFASPLGVKLNVENILNEVTEPPSAGDPATGHFSDIGFCLDRVMRTSAARAGDGAE